MNYNRKQLRNITGLPDKTLRWLLDRLDIEPVGVERTVFGSPIYIYDDNALHELHAYIFHRQVLKNERAKGLRCRGGCNRYFPPAELNSQQICDQCRRYAWLRNEVCHHDPSAIPPDPVIITELRSALDTFK